MIKTLSISNFKSIKQLEMDCKRINLFIGAPNVGKSNILEALSLFSVPYEINSTQKFSQDIRFLTLRNLFFNNIPNYPIEVRTNIGFSHLKFSDNMVDFWILPERVSIPTYDIQEKYYDKDFNSDNLKCYFTSFQTNGNPRIPSERRDYYSSIRKYIFKKDFLYNHGFQDYLLPPFGQNLNTVIQCNQQIYSEVSSFFEEYNLELVLDLENNIFEIQKKINRTAIKYPFNLIADTLQRIIFYLTAVETNKNTTILFEEPETHSYPPYTRMLAERIAKNESNQFFITTHSPYLLYSIVENTNFDELNVLVTYNDNYQTKVKRLNKDEIIKILDDSIDVFFNLDKFIGNE